MVDKLESVLEERIGYLEGIIEENIHYIEYWHSSIITKTKENEKIKEQINKIKEILKK